MKNADPAAGGPNSPADAQGEHGARHIAALFGRNTLASVFVFAIDVALLWAMVEQAHIPYWIAGTIAFLIAISIHYVISRRWIFPGSDRGMAAGYAFFLVNAGVGLVITMGGLVLLVEFLHLHYLVARVIASVASGIVVFFLNAIFNFREI